MPFLKPASKRNPNTQRRPKVKYTHNWHKIRNAYFMSHPLCENCLKENIIKPTEEVHHIIPISTAGDDIEKQHDLMLNTSNLIALCKECHHKIHKAMKKGDQE